MSMSPEREGTQEYAIEAVAGTTLRQLAMPLAGVITRQRMGCSRPPRHPDSLAKPRRVGLNPDPRVGSHVPHEAGPLAQPGDQPEGVAKKTVRHRHPTWQAGLATDCLHQRIGGRHEPSLDQSDDDRIDYPVLERQQPPEHLLPVHIRPYRRESGQSCPLSADRPGGGGDRGLDFTPR